MDSPSLDSAGSPVSSIDASERPSLSNNKHVRREEGKLMEQRLKDVQTCDTYHITASTDDMQIDENTPLPASSGDGQRKRKTEDPAKEKSQSSKTGKDSKRSSSPKILQSNRSDDSDDSDEVSMVVTSKQAKRPKLAGAFDTRFPTARSTLANN